MKTKSPNRDEGISTQYVSNIERGKENPTLDMLFNLADALKVPLVETCDFEDLNRGKVQTAIRQTLKMRNTDELRIALKILRAVLD
jgi:transcriptional regulator with XRE-family HTH domain